MPEIRNFSTESSIDEIVTYFKEYFEDSSKSFKVARKIQKVEIILDDVTCYKFSPKNPKPNECIFYLHGGGYICGSINSYESLCSYIAKFTGLRVFYVEYRLAPEHPFPAALEDAKAAYDKLISAELGHFEKIIVMGDSAGAGLSVALCQDLIAEQIRLPNGIVCISPWFDLTNSGESINDPEASKMMINKTLLDAFAISYAGTNDPKNSLISPMFGDLTGLPPIFIQGGTLEVLYSSFLEFAEKCKKVGVDCELDIWEGGFHVFHILVGIPFLGSRIPEIKGAFANIISFIKNL